MYDSHHLILPHGGILIDRQLKFSDCVIDLDNLPTLAITPEQAMDCEQLALGGFSPLEGFLAEHEFHSVAERCRLSNELVWPLPIILQVPKYDFNRLAGSKRIVLVEKTSAIRIGLLEVEDFYRINLEQAAKKIFTTNDSSHPGVQELVLGGECVIGGKVSLIERRPAPFKNYELTPQETRAEFKNRGWSCVVGFHTRNPIHRSHEAIQLRAMQIAESDGLFVHPVVGKKKAGDFQTEVIIDSYEVMLEKFYPTGKVLFATFASYSRYAGPREALFTAICRQNYGCSHFVVGRDHTGVGNFYAPDESHAIFDKFPDIAIKPIRLAEIAFSQKLGDYVEANTINSKDLQSISGTRLREMFEKRELPPAWFMRSEISERIIQRIRSEQRVFV